MRNLTDLTDDQRCTVYMSSHVFGTMLPVVAPLNKFTHLAYVLLTLITSAWFPFLSQRLRVMNPLSTWQTQDLGCDVPLIHPACAQGSLCLGHLHMFESSWNKDGIFNISTAVRYKRFCADAKSWSCDANLACIWQAVTNVLSFPHSIFYHFPKKIVSHLLLFDITLQGCNVGRNANTHIFFQSRNLSTSQTTDPTDRSIKLRPKSPAASPCKTARSRMKMAVCSRINRSCDWCNSISSQSNWMKIILKHSKSLNSLKVSKSWFNYLMTPDLIQARFDVVNQIGSTAIDEVIWVSFWSNVSISFSHSSWRRPTSSTPSLPWSKEMSQQPWDTGSPTTSILKWSKIVLVYWYKFSHLNQKEVGQMPQLETVKIDWNSWNETPSSWKFIHPVDWIIHPHIESSISKDLDEEL